MKLRITVHGNSYEVEVEVLDPGEGFPTGPLPRVAPIAGPQSAPKNGNTAAPPPSSAQPASRKPQSAASGDGEGTVSSPIAGTILELKCKAGDDVSANQELVVIEAMKMETSIAAPSGGKIKSVDVSVGDAVREGQTLVQFE